MGQVLGLLQYYSSFSLHQCTWIYYKFPFIVVEYNGFNVAHNQICHSTQFFVK